MNEGRFEQFVSQPELEEKLKKAPRKQRIFLMSLRVKKEMNHLLMKINLKMKKVQTRETLERKLQVLLKKMV